jgi:hypothetical protein
MIRFCSVVAMSVLCQATLAQTVYKCSADGKPSYSDRPCAHGPSVALPPPAAGVAPPEAGAVATRDARTLLELEKLRMARDKEQAQAQREQQKLARAASARRKTCDKLRLRRKWAEEDLARAQTHAKPEAREAARLKARRQAEALAVECPA